jgi:putative transposase
MEVKFAPHCSYQIRYHQVFCMKYRKKLLKNEEYRLYLKYILQEICERYYLEIDEVGTDWDHIHIFVWAASKYAPSNVMQILKSITAKMMFKQFPEIKRTMLRWWEFRSDWWYIWTVGEWTNEQIIKKYIQNQWDEKTYKYEQLSLFKLN